uniref:Odorant binding protein 7 n=1 Tax=Cyrtorhinus lividipennis TaxID=1032904 RepID=A0A1W6AWH6_9HEMI|nr:odorant binding protein 7 [Cyrtorhinus lividipennis]
MKYFIVSVVLTLLAVVAVKANEKKANEKVTEIFNKCRKNHPVTDEEVEQIKVKQEIPSSENVKCILACMLKEAKVLKDGKYDEENAKLMADVLHKDEPEHAEKSKEIIATCVKEVGIDATEECEYAYKMAKCGSEHAKKVGLKTPEF